MTRRSPIAASLAAIVSMFAALVLLSADANARTSRHEQVEIKPIKQKGEVVGIRVSLTLRPAVPGHTRVRIGIGPKGGSKSPTYRNQAAGKESFLLRSLGEIKGLQPNVPMQETFEILYKDAPELSPGSDIQVVSAWSGKEGDYWHVWGMTNSVARGTNYKLPGEAATARGTLPRGKAAATKQAAGKDRAAVGRAVRRAKATTATSRRAAATTAARTTAPRGRAR